MSDKKEKSGVSLATTSVIAGMMTVIGGMGAYIYMDKVQDNEDSPVRIVSDEQALPAEVRTDLPAGTEVITVSADPQTPAPVPADIAPVPDAVTELKHDVISEAPVSAIPSIVAAIERGRILTGDVSSVDWGKDNLGYVGKAAPGDIIPGMEGMKSAPDEWVIGDSETEGGGEVAPRYETVTGPVSLNSDGTIQIGEKSFMLSGILTPNENSTCYSSGGEEFNCYEWARSGIEQHLSDKRAFCTVTYSEQQEYGLCDVIMSNDGEGMDLASWLVSAGISIAHDMPTASLYWSQQNKAQNDKNGLWGGEFSLSGEG